MEREKKYRIWNGIEMIYDVTTGKFGTFYVNPENGDGLNPKDKASLTTNTTKYPKNTPEMEYINVVDSNQIEIYSGDIVGWFDKEQNYIKGVIEYCFQRVGFHIKYEIFPFRAIYSRDINVTYGDGEIFQDGTIEVISNIYQNPELCKQ